MEQPMCLITSTDIGELEVMEEALEILRGLDQPVVVVAIVGLYRTGKSYLLNRLAGKSTGFSLGSTVQSHTKGIWMWCVPHPCKAGHILVLLDTEGLGDVEKLWAPGPFLPSGNPVDSLLQCPSAPGHTLVLLSTEGLGDVEKFSWAKSHFISCQKLENTYIEKILRAKWGLVSPASLDVRGTKLNPRSQFHTSNPKNDAWIFALAVLLSSTLVYNSKGTIDQYAMDQLHFVSEISKCIQTKAGDEDDSQYCRFFPKFIWAVRDFTLELKIKGEGATEHDYLESTLTRKKVFGSLVQSYVRTIQSGQVPCPENMVTAMATIENEAAVKEALVHYTAGMGAQKLPVALGELSEVHRRCEAEALALFMQRSFKDEECLSQKWLMEAIKERYVKLLGENEAASKNSCHALLEELSAVMQKKLSDGVYCQPGGYEVYLRDQSQLVEDFRKAPNKGVKTEEVLEQFLASKRTEARTVLSVDKKMTEAEKSLAEEKQKAEMLEQQQKVMKEKQLQTEQLMKDQERSHQEHMRQLEAKVAEAVASAQQEAKRALECKLKEQEAMLQQGFKEKATMMEEEIAKLREEMSDKKMQELLRMAKVYGMVLRVIYDTFVRDVKNDNHHPS